MPTTPVNPNDTFLKDLQANIIKGHGRKFAHHLFFRLNPEKIQSAKEWIANLASSNVTSAKAQLDGTAAFNSGAISDAGPIITLSLTATGYQKLGQVSAMPASASFKGGLKGSAQLLADKPDSWDEPFRQEIDFLVIVADTSSNNAKLIADQIIAESAGFANLSSNQRGNILKTKTGLGIEHFGYADGISQPLYLADEIHRQNNHTQWKDETNLDLLIVKDPGGLEDESFGSFLVFRKLEQNVKAFRDSEGDNPPIPGSLPTINNANGLPEPELAGAMIVGRFENSIPVVQSSTGAPSNPPSITNDFDYRDDLPANKCPFHSHIRLMNPRNGDVVAGDVKEHRITRRGIPYDDVNRIPEDRIDTITDDLLDQNQPTAGVGLLFMCYQSKIENQFEILQAFWANRGQIGRHEIKMEDSLISQGMNPAKTLPPEYGKPGQTAPFSFSGFVTMKGGEYFFTPSISFLRQIAPITTNA